MLPVARSLRDGIDSVWSRGYAPRTLSNIPSRMLSKVKLVRAKKLALLVLGGVLGSAILTTARPGRAPSEKKAAHADVAAGKKLFERHCALCHGIDGKG